MKACMHMTVDYAYVGFEKVVWAKLVTLTYCILCLLCVQMSSHEP